MFRNGIGCPVRRDGTAASRAQVRWAVSYCKEPPGRLGGWHGRGGPCWLINERHGGGVTSLAGA